MKWHGDSLKHGEVDMNTLERSLIEKAGNDNGWEFVRESTEQRITLASLRHECEVAITPIEKVEGEYRLVFSRHIDKIEVIRGMPEGIVLPGNTYRIWSVSLLGDFLHRVAELFTALPTRPLDEYEKAVAAEISGSTDILGTESERLVRVRIGQDVYRKALFAYWKEQCAVTGITIPQMLRASHAKPWAECESDSERLNVYNGFLLAAHLDALFDTGLISFNDTGSIMISSMLPSAELKLLSIDQTTTLRWIDSRHIPFLSWHREKVFIK